MIKFEKLLFLVLLLVCSCQSKETKNEDNSSVADFYDSTAYQFPKVKIPTNFALNYMNVYDSLSRANYEIYYLQSTEESHKIFNQMMVDFMRKQIADDQVYVDEYKGDSYSDIIYSYELSPLEIYQDSQVLSISSMIDSYTEGGNHHNYEQITFNYHLGENRILGFDDVFNLPNQKDTFGFVNFVEEYSDGCNNWGRIHNGLDFSFKKDTICINPNLGWACSGTRSFLPINAGRKFFHKKWLKE